LDLSEKTLAQKSQQALVSYLQVVENFCQSVETADVAFDWMYKTKVSPLYPKPNQTLVLLKSFQFVLQTKPPSKANLII
jgi:hypothetical protein